MKTFYGLYYDFALQRRIELYDNFAEFVGRLNEFVSIEFEPYIIEIHAKSQEEAQNILEEEAKRGL